LSASAILLWIILAYVAAAPPWRSGPGGYRGDHCGWTSGSSQLFEQKILGGAGPAFHDGAFAAVGGHIFDLMIPRSPIEAVAARGGDRQIRHRRLRRRLRPHGARRASPACSCSAPVASHMAAAAPSRAPVREAHRGAICVWWVIGCR
jgi:hypothetical protein